MKTKIIAENMRDNIRVWGAIILDIDPEWYFKRKFKSYRYLDDCSSSYAYYNYYIDVEEGQFIEVAIESQWKNKRYYYQLKNNEFISIDVKTIRNYFK